MDTGNGTHGNKQPGFKFELGWLSRDDFYELVVDVWNNKLRGKMLLQKWKNEIQRLRQFLRGWAKNVRGNYKKEKAELIRKADELVKKAEMQPLSDREIDRKSYFKERLILLLREEEIKWYQRAKMTKLLCGDCNTKYFHLVANGKHRKTRIFV
jgi:hypothetical protein